MTRRASVLLVLAATSFWAGAAAPPSEAPRPLPMASLVGPGPIGPPAKPVVPPPEAKRTSAVIDACVEAAMLNHDTPGATVAVIRDGESIYSQGYGVKRRDSAATVGADTIFRIGSITKQLTAAAVMQQVEAGAVDLDDPVSLYVPELALAGRWSGDTIRIRHLLTHSSGYPDNLSSVAGGTDDDALSDWALNQAGVTLHAAPGSFWNYSNPNYMLAGLVVERASGIPYHQYMEERVFQAAGLSRTTFDINRVRTDGDYSWGHFNDPYTGKEVVFHPADYDNWAAAPAGWAFSTASDLARWALLLSDGGGELLSPASVTAMQSPHTFIDPAPASYYGYGIFIDLYEGLELREHGGNIPGWGAYLLWIPERRDVVAVLANTFDSLPEAAYCILDNVLGVPGGDLIIIDPTPTKWSSLAGAWAGMDSLGRPYEARVVEHGGILWLDVWLRAMPDDLLHARMIPAFRDTYVVDTDDDGAFDLDLSFVSSDGAPGRVRWLVNRSMVLESAEAPRRGAPR